MVIHRRRFLGAALGALGAGAVARPAEAAAPRSLAFYNTHTGESLKATYWEGGSYVPDALDAFNHILRDFRTGDVKPISPDLFDLVSNLRARLDTRETIQIISGYRSPATNASLHARSDGVATHSLHMQGEAMDLRIAGVDLDRIRDAALSLQGGGVGYYPQSQFVHMDVGRVRRWNGA